MNNKQYCTTHSSASAILVILACPVSNDKGVDFDANRPCVVNIVDGPGVIFESTFVVVEEEEVKPNELLDGGVLFATAEVNAVVVVFGRCC